MKMKCRSPRWACVVFFTVTSAANAQFKVIGPAPFPEPVARQKIRTLLENVDPGNRQQTVDTITGWLVWYRDLFDEELIAAFHLTPDAIAHTVLTWKGNR